MRDLATVDAQWLIQQPFMSPSWVIEDLLTAGLPLLVGSPKAGKSWMALRMALCVSTGAPFWDLQTNASDVLYLCLEDTKSRVQQRLWKLTDKASQRLHIATSASKIGGDLIPQLREFLTDNPETRLIIIDTLQMARSVSKDSAYAADYGDMNALKKFADKNGLGILCIHHNRKMGESDVFNTVSGTNGITGAANCTMVLNNLNRSAHRATLSVTGRDVEFQEYKIRMNDCEWELIEKTSKEELGEREVPRRCASCPRFHDDPPSGMERHHDGALHSAEPGLHKRPHVRETPGPELRFHGGKGNCLHPHPHARGKHSEP